MVQENVTVFDGEDPRKFEVGRRLRFVKYDEIEQRSCYGSYTLEELDAWPETFAAGDILTVMPRNGCGMGIDVVREVDGTKDMVFAEEVELVD